MHAVVVVAALASLALAGPAPIVAKQSLQALSTAQIAALRPFTLFASAGYCSAKTTATWTCGANCNALPGFLPTASGGDGSVTQFWFVGFHPPLNSVIVAHQGTDPDKIIPLLTDGAFALVPLNSTLFPAAPAGVQVHEGFRNSHATSAAAILSAVQRTLTAHSGASVTFASHSLGAALGLLDALFLRPHFPASTRFKFVGYGVPRIGNAAFANFVDANLPDFTRVNNQQDPVPIIPGRFLGYKHPSGEVHISEQEQWLVCPGQDSTAVGCIIQTEPTIFDGDINNHDGPYDNIHIGC
ncbi:lipase [Auricularia subglabra TFB-10046 SS5]|nr:lipase [Auricularia subglabra TFB-10046 SS5]